MCFLVVYIVRILNRLLSSLTCFQVFFGLLPVNRHDEILILLRSVHFQQGIGLFGIVTAEEEPAVRFSFTGMAQVEVDTGAAQLEGDIHLTILFAHTDEADGTLEILFVGIDGHIAVVVIRRYAETCSGHYVLGIFGDEGRTVITAAVGQFDDLGGTEGSQVDACHAGCIVGIAEHPTSVDLAIGLRKFGVMQVVPRHNTMRGIKHRFGFLAVAVTFLRVYGKHGDYAEQAAAWQAVHAHLSAETTRDKIVEFVVFTGGYIRFGSSIGVHG